jgi:hypothetical protein
MTLACSIKEQAKAHQYRLALNLILLFANLFSGTLSRQSLLYSKLLARLKVVGMTLHFLDDVFRLNLALKSAKGVLQRLALLQSNFCQTHHPQTSPNRTYKKLIPFVLSSVELIAKHRVHFGHQLSSW